MQTFTALCRLEWRYSQLDGNGLQFLANYLALKLELFPLSEEEEDWTYNHRIHRMIDGIGLLLVCNRVIDIAEVVDGLLKVGFKANTK